MRTAWEPQYGHFKDTFPDAPLLVSPGFAILDATVCLHATQIARRLGIDGSAVTSCMAAPWDALERTFCCRQENFPAWINEYVVTTNRASFLEREAGSR